MKGFSKIKAVLIILGIIFVFPIFSNTNLSFFQESNTRNLERDNEQKLIRAGYWEIGPIEIDDNDPTKNWSITAATYEWCSGSGTINNPYLISNVTVNLGGAEGNCIAIINSNAYFIIKNCFLNNTSYRAAYYAGINLENVNNGKIVNNSIKYVSSGIYFSGDNITIYNNLIIGALFGIIGGGSFINITKNEYQVHPPQYGEIEVGVFNSIIKDNNLQGSKLDLGGDNNILLNNLINTTTTAMVDSIVLAGNNATLKNNSLTRGVYVGGNYQQLTSHTIDKSNLVNNKPLYYYKKTVNLNSNNFTDPGQIILIGCNNSVISDISISKCCSSIISYYCKNITFSNNHLKENRRDAIFLSYCSNATIFNNILNRNMYGVRLYECNDTIIIENEINDNQHLLGECLQGRGIYLYKSNHTKIIRNQLYRNFLGVRLFGCKHNRIAHNDICHNSLGILLSKDVNPPLNSNFNSIFNNTLFNNSYYGVDIQGDFNLFYMNKFIENNLNARDNGVNNLWDNGSIGNYWDDYRGLDSNDDGIGDTPYSIRGDSNSKDNFPVILNLPPLITIHAPLLNQIFYNDAPQFNVTIYDANLDKMWYTIQGGVTRFFLNDTTGIINQSQWELIPSGEVSIKFWANDTRGNIAYKEVVVIKELPGELPEEPAIPGYSIFLIMNLSWLLAIISVYYFRSKIKKR